MKGKRNLLDSPDEGDCLDEKPPRIDGKTLVNRIRAKTLDPADLTRDERLECVLFLESGGMPKAAMARLLSCGSTAIDTYVRELGERAQKHSLDVVALLGRLERHADYVASNCLRLALKAEKDSEYSAAAGSLWKCWRTWKEFMETLQSLGLAQKEPERIEVLVTERAKQIFFRVIDVVIAEVDDRQTRERIKDAVGKQLRGLVGEGVGGAG